jgi:hypothetical protein
MLYISMKKATKMQEIIEDGESHDVTGEGLG